MQPNEDEQGWVLDSLHNLIEQKGIQPFVSAHLLTPTEEFFPDTWTPDKEGVQQVLSRMMVYAGLQDLQVSLVLSGQPNQELNGLIVTPYEKKPAGWFAGIRHNCCFFGMDVEHIHEPEEVVAVFGHEVAHAYRHYHQLEVEDIEEEERLTDLTCVYLGFGIFNTNSSFRYRSGGFNGLSTEGHQWSIQSKGYLSPELFSFALAVQWIVRDLPNMERTQLLRHLETNQRSYVRKTLKRLKGQRASLCHRLNIPPREDWPSTPPLEDLLKEDITFDTFWSTEKKPKHTGFADLFGGISKSRRRDEASSHSSDVQNKHIVFRVPTDSSVPIILVLSLVGLFGGNYLSGGAFVFAFTGMFLGGWLGYKVGMRWTLRDECSDPDCMERLPKEADSCPRCGGHIVGMIHTRNQRLAAEEEWHETKGDREEQAYIEEIKNMMSH